MPTVHCSLPSAPSTDSRQQPFGILGNVVEQQPALALLRPAAAQGNQPRQPAVGGPIGGPKHHRRGVVGRNLGADDQFQARRPWPPHVPEPRRPGCCDRHRQGGISQLGRPANQLVGMRGPFEKGEVRFGVEFGVHRFTQTFRAKTIFRRAGGGRAKSGGRRWFPRGNSRGPPAGRATSRSRSAPAPSCARSCVPGCRGGNATAAPRARSTWPPRGSGRGSNRSGRGGNRFVAQASRLLRRSRDGCTI